MDIGYAYVWNSSWVIVMLARKQCQFLAAKYRRSMLIAPMVSGTLFRFYSYSICSQNITENQYVAAEQLERWY